MRRLLRVHFTLAMVVLLMACAVPAAASTGGAPAPEAGVAPSAAGGGSPYVDGKARRPARRAPSRRRPWGPVLASFRLGRPLLFLYGAPARLSFLIRSRARLAAVRISITPLGARRAAA